MQAITILDGPLGTELEARGVATTLPLWSAAAIESAPEVIAAIHRDYARAGATLHTANTFRAQPRLFGDRFAEIARSAVALARSSVPAHHRVAGSIAPIEDCYRPDLSPGLASRARHRALARVLAEAGVDVLLCETFPAVDEACVAVEECVATGVPTYLSLTAGPDADLLGPDALRRGAERAVSLGAQAVLVNCVPAMLALPFVAALSDLGVPFGVYANAGRPDDRIGWETSEEPGASLYAELARGWLACGASIVGGCCGTGPGHVAALAALAAEPAQAR